MAGTSTGKDEKDTADVKEAAPEEPTYHRDRLQAEADAFFGVPGHVVAGALALMKPGNKVNFTRSEMEQAISKFQAHEVEIDG